MGRKILIVVCGSSVVCVGSIVLFGYFLKYTSMYQPIPDTVPMAIHTAICFIITGVALIAIGCKNNGA